MMAGRHRTASAIATACHQHVAVTGGLCGRWRQTGIVGAVNECNVVFVEAEWTTHHAVETEHIAHQLDRTRKLPAICIARKSPVTL